MRLILSIIFVLSFSSAVYSYDIKEEVARHYWVPCLDWIIFSEGFTEIDRNVFIDKTMDDFGNAVDGFQEHFDKFPTYFAIKRNRKLVYLKSLNDVCINPLPEQFTSK